MKKKILIIASAPRSLINFRGDFIKDLVTNNYEVYAAAPEIDAKTTEQLTSLGAKPLEFKLQRTSLNPLADFNSIKQLKSLIKNNKIDLVFPYTIKPVIYGSIAAKQLNIPTISLITGLGYTFSGQSFKSKVLQKITQFLYRTALKRNDFIFFQNIDDYKLFLEKKIITKKQPYQVVSGSGVNLSRFKYREKINNGEKIIFVFVARLIKEKGILLYIEAAKKLKLKYPNTEFRVFGGIAPESPSGINGDILKTENTNKNIVYNGYSKNMMEDLRDSDVFVLPTFYREGVPRSILEALSIGMPIITTNTPGCRETIINGDHNNGILIEPKNLTHLVNAMETFIKSPELINKMGKNSRLYAQKRFDVNIINKQLINQINVTFSNTIND